MHEKLYELIILQSSSKQNNTNVKKIKIHDKIIFKDFKLKKIKD